VILRGLLIAAATGMALAAVPAAAQAFDNKRPMGETASDAAFGFCPLLLAGQLPLKDNDMLTSRGFSGTPKTATDPRWGTVESVEATFPEGKVTFGGVSEKTCSVTLAGSGRAAAAKAVKDSLGLFPIALAPDAADSGKRGGGDVEAFSAKVEGQGVYHMLIITMPDSAPAPVTAIQFYLTAE
jgi:hypothetical protein